MRAFFNVIRLLILLFSFFCTGLAANNFGQKKIDIYSLDVPGLHNKDGLGAGPKVAKEGDKEGLAAAPKVAKDADEDGLVAGPKVAKDVNKDGLAAVPKVARCG